MVDKLTYQYAPFSNQPRFIDDETQDTDPTLNDFKDNGSLNSPTANPEFAYDANGNMVMDANKGIMIQYNHLNLPRTVTFTDGKTITWIYDATGRKLQKRTCELRSGSTPITISDVKRPNYIDQHRHLSERIKHISTNRTPAEATLDIIDYYNATNTKIQTAIQQEYVQTGTPPVVEPDRESCTLRDYVLGLEYLNQEPEAYYHEEGRINLLAGGRIEYTLKDHLGNGRVYCFHDAALNQAKTIQEAHYYPFGLPIQKLSTNFEAPLGVEANNYQYNNKELNEDFGLHWMDYGARWYNPQINLWGQVDPLAEKYYAWSGYNYVGNNPIVFIDPDGRYKFPAGKDYSNYKRFTSYLNNNISEILQSGNIMGGLQKFGQLSEGAIKNMVKTDNGPVVEIVDNIPFGGSGYYTGGKNGKIQILRSLVEGLESASEEDMQAHLLLVVSTLLHESVHYGDWQDGDPDDNTETFYKMVEIDGESFPQHQCSEKGHLFESEVYRNGEWQTTIENLDDAKKVIEQKSQTEEGLKDLPTIPK